MCLGMLMECQQIRSPQCDMLPMGRGIVIVKRLTHMGALILRLGGHDKGDHGARRDLGTFFGHVADVDCKSHRYFLAGFGPTLAFLVDDAFSWNLENDPRKSIHELVHPWLHQKSHMIRDEVKWRRLGWRPRFHSDQLRV